MEGFFKIQRKFFSHWLWDEKRSFSKAEAFLDLLQIAVFTDKGAKRIIKGKLIELEQGELIASTRYLSVRWDWGKDKVATFLKMLESDKMIRRKTRQSQTVVTLCNYSKYARVYSSSPDSDKDSDQTVTRQSPDKVEEGKERKKKVKNKKGFQPPEYSEFEKYLIESMPKVNPEWTPERVSRASRLQFDTYEENFWKDGNGNQVKNWKTKAKNALSYKKAWQFGNQENLKTTTTDFSYKL